MARELALTYGTFVIDGTGGRHLDGKVRINKSFTQTTFEFDFIIAKTSNAAFITEVLAAETEFRKPFLDLKLEQSGTSMFELLHSTNSGLNTQPTIIKREDVGDTGRSRRYTVQVAAEMPADNVPGTSGLRESTVNLSVDSSNRKTITISGVFTAVVGTSARAKHDAEISAFTTAVLASFTGTFELIGRPREESDREDKLLRFSRVFEEIIFNQTGAVLDNAAIVSQSLRISKQRIAPGDAPKTTRLNTITATYDASIDKEVETSLRIFYEFTIRAFIVDEVRIIANQGTIALVDEKPQFDFDANRISAVLVFQSIEQFDFLERRLSVEDNFIFGRALVPTWSGDRSSKFVFQGPSTRQRIITDIVKVPGLVLLSSKEIVKAQSEARIRQLFGISLPGTGNLIHLSSRTTSTPLRLGQDALIIDITEIVRVDVFEFFKPISSTGQIPTA